MQTKSTPDTMATSTANNIATGATSTTSTNNNSNVIIIKYANVTANKQHDETTLQQQEQQLNVYKLHGEPLSVSIIESRFANSISLFDVSYNQLSTLSKDLFCPLSNEVRQLNISHNLLENFDCLGLISQNGQLCLSELRTLDMSNNLIKHLPATGVATLHNLEVLNLSGNLIESLHELSLSSLFKLTKLDLSSNRIQQLPIAIFHKSSSMQVLKLQSNFIQTSITNQLLADLVSLEEINLSHNNISQVGDFAFVDKVNLTRVDLTFNQLSGLRPEALRVSTNLRGTSTSQLTTLTTTKHRLHHNGQYAGTVATPQAITSNRTPTTSNVEFLLSSNPFICDCNLDWLRKYQQPNGSISGARRNQHHFQANQQHHQSSVLTDHYGDSLGAQLPNSSNNNHQNDQPQPVIHASSDPSNNISEMLLANSQQQQASNSRLPLATMLTSSSSGHQTASSTNHYSRIGDLDLIKCSPLFRRNNQKNNNGNVNNNHQHRHHSHHSHYHPGASGQHRGSVAPSGDHHNGSLMGRHSYNQTSDNTMIDLLTADSSNFLCRYKSHCFALCHCCEFDACDCEMICPTGCQCYYDSTWQTNIIDCSSNNHTVVPDRIPMDVSGLYLDGNNIDSLRPSNLIARKSLKTLYLNSTNLQHIANRTFNGLIELQTLYLNDNMLKTLNGYEFEPLSQLRALHLQSNRLDHISNQTFIFLRSLEILDLSNNRLTSSNLDLFWSIGHHNIRLRQLSIAHNWWSCQCDSIKRFRQILKQKFLLNGSFNVVDKNQLRCYYNSTTVGPLILADGSPALQQQQPLYAFYGAGNRQQQTQLTEINQCSELVEEKPESSNVNPPLIYPFPESQSNTPSSESPNDPLYIQDISQPYPSAQSKVPLSDQSTPMIISPSDMPGYGFPGTGVQRPDMTPSSSAHGGGMPLTTAILSSILILGIFAIAISLFVFIRQQRVRFHKNRRHKKSSAASTTSGSSSNASSTIDHHHHHHHSQHPTIKSAHHRNDNHLHQQHHALLGSHPQHQQHHLIMSGSGVTTTATLANHHHHSASSQSNIYAALVSPTTGNSTIVTSATSNMNLNLSGGNTNNIYSNTSTTASHRSGNSGIIISNNGGGSVHPTSYWNGSVPQQASVYGQGAYGANGAVESPYAYNVAQSQASYKTTGSLYNAPGNCHDINLNSANLQQQNDWIKLPKVKQFMSKLVNKSLALGGYRSSSRDELSTITSSDKIYDAFISYDKGDEAFVMQHLSAELEYGQPQYRVADRFRDLPLPTSAYIAEAITSVIGCSHRTIVVLTENYLASEWCRYELQAALQESLVDKSHKIIAVVLDPKCLLDMDSEMRALLTNNNGNNNANISIYQHAPSAASPQLVQLDGMEQQQQQQHQLVATLTNQTGASPQVCTQTVQLATSRINFINYKERKFWPKIKQLMPTPRPPTQTLTLTTKN